MNYLDTTPQRRGREGAPEALPASVQPHLDAAGLYAREVHAKLDHGLLELQPPSLCPKHLVYHRADLGQRTDGRHQWVEHDRVMHRLHVARQSGLDGQLLHVDVGAVEGCELRRIVFDRRWLDAVRVDQARNLHTATIRKTMHEPAVGHVAVDLDRRCFVVSTFRSSWLEAVCFLNQGIRFRTSVLSYGDGSFSPLPPDHKLQGDCGAHLYLRLLCSGASGGTGEIQDCVPAERVALDAVSFQEPYVPQEPS